MCKQTKESIWPYIESKPIVVQTQEGFTTGRHGKASGSSVKVSQHCTGGQRIQLCQGLTCLAIRLIPGLGNIMGYTCTYWLSHELHKASISWEKRKTHTYRAKLRVRAGSAAQKGTEDMTEAH